MRSVFRCGLAVLACSVFIHCVAYADERDAVIADGPSRGELFEARMKAEYGPTVINNAVAKPFVIPSDVLGDAVYGIDVSHHNDPTCVCKGPKCAQCKIDWSRATRQKIGFVYVKTTQGTRFKDPTFDYHWRALAQNNISRGPSHFMAADEDPVEQADHFVDRLQEHGKLTDTDLPPCLELESDLRKDSSKKWIVVSETGEKLDFWKGQEPDEIMGKILKWLKRVEERTGRTPIVYTSRGWWRDRIKDDKKFAVLKRYPIWIANYPESGRPANDSPKVPNDQSWTLWHFSDNGRMNDNDIIPGNFDVNIFKGTLVKFRSAMGMAPPTSQDVARSEETSPPVQQNKKIASLTPTQTTDADTQKVSAEKSSQNPGSLDVNPSTEAKQPAPQLAAVNPDPPPIISKPPPQAAAGQTPSPGQSATKPTEPVATAPSSRPAETAAPSPPPVAAPPVAAAPVAAAPSVAAPAAKSTEQTASINQEQKNFSPPSPPTPAVTAAAKADTAQKSAPAGAKLPAAATAAAKAEQKVAAAAEKTSVEAAAADKGVGEKAGSAKTPEKVMIEIELSNGRKIRVDANIDPAVLSRLISAIDK